MIRNKRVIFICTTTGLITLMGLLAYYGHRKILHANRPNVLLITIDTLRADHVGTFGYPVKTSPQIDSLASRGITFTNCMAQWPKTWPSMASLLTGAYPKTTGMRYKHSYMPSSLTLLSHIFRSAHYKTGAVVSNFHIGKTYGFHQGFDFFLESWEKKWKEEKEQKVFINKRPKVKNYTNATIVTDQALSWLDNLESRDKFFLWLHYMDPHGPYRPPKKYESYFLNSPSYPSHIIDRKNIPKYQRHHNEKTGKIIVNIDHYIRRYDQSIRYNDDEIGRLLERMSTRGQLKNTVIVLTADHGESLGEHNCYFRHGIFSYQASAHVPLVILYPNKLPKRLRITHPVGLIDVAPTLLELAHLTIPDQFEGQSLLYLVKDPSGKTFRKAVFMESGRNPKKPQLTIRSGPWKLIDVLNKKTRRLMGGAKRYLFNIDKDPGETKNLIDQHAALTKKLSRELWQWYKPKSPGPKEEEKIDVNSFKKEEKEMLRSLGYLN